MNRIKYDSDLIKLMTIFESISGAKVKDCIADDKVIFIIEENDMGKAIGRNGINIKKMENATKKKIKLVEFSQDPVQFIRNFIYPMQALQINNEEGIITIHGKDSNSKAIIIGRERQNLNQMLEIAKRYFDLKEIKVI